MLQGMTQLLDLLAELIMYSVKYKNYLKMFFTKYVTCNVLFENRVQKIPNDWLSM